MDDPIARGQEEGAPALVLPQARRLCGAQVHEEQGREPLAGADHVLGGLPAAEKDQLLATFCDGSDALLAAKLRRRFEKEQSRAAPAEPGSAV